MSDNFKNSKFYQAMKNPKISRAVYISAVLILVAIAVVVGITAAANRTKKPVKNPEVTTEAPEQTEAPKTEATEPEAEKPEKVENTTASSGTVSKPLPTFSLPAAGKVTKFHDAEAQVFSNTMNDYRVHLGIDIMTAAGAPVYAAADGKISKIWSDPLMGYCIAIEHDGDAVTVYKNLSNETVEGIMVGASVKAGQKIATVGESAMVEIADEPHLHLEMTVGGLLVDPLEYFSAKDVASLGGDSSYEG